MLNPKKFDFRRDNTWNITNFTTALIGDAGIRNLQLQKVDTVYKDAFLAPNTAQT